MRRLGDYRDLFEQWNLSEASWFAEDTPDPLNYSDYASFETDGGSLSRGELHELWRNAYALSDKEKKSFPAGKKFLNAVDDWIDDQVDDYIAKIKKRTKDYKRRKLKLTAKDLKGWPDAIRTIEDIRRSLAESLRDGKAHGDDLLVLASVVWNEANALSDKAMLAIAYAYLNQATPSTKTISDYKSLKTRWSDFGDGKNPNTLRLSFLKSFVRCLAAALKRLDAPDPTKSDPTRGADHWVSPVHPPMPLYDASKPSHVADRYSRTYGGVSNLAFPKWARDPSDPEVAVMKKAGQLRSNYDEFTAKGVPDTEFLFYTGVK